MKSRYLATCYPNYLSAGVGGLKSFALHEEPPLGRSLADVSLTHSLRADDYEAVNQHFHLMAAANRAGHSLVDGSNGLSKVLDVD